MVARWWLESISATTGTGGRPPATIQQRHRSPQQRVKRLFTQNLRAKRAFFGHADESARAGTPAIRPRGAKEPTAAFSMDLPAGSVPNSHNGAGNRFNSATATASWQPGRLQPARGVGSPASLPLFPEPSPSAPNKTGRSYCRPSFPTSTSAFGRSQDSTKKRFKSEPFTKSALRSIAIYVDGRGRSCVKSWLRSAFVAVAL